MQHSPGKSTLLDVLLGVVSNNLCIVFHEVCQDSTCLFWDKQHKSISHSKTIRAQLGFLYLKWVSSCRSFQRKNYDNCERDWQYYRFFHNCHRFLVQNCDNCEILTIVLIPAWKVATFVNAWHFKWSWIDL